MAAADADADAGCGWCCSHGMRLPGCGVVEVEIRGAVACRSELMKVGWLCVPPRRKRARD